MQQEIESWYDSEFDTIAKELGYISIYFSTFDWIINELNKSLINIDNSKIGEIITNELFTHARLSLCKKLLETIPLKGEAKILTLSNLNTFNQIKDKRNIYVHGLLHYKHTDDNEAGIHISSIKEFSSNKSKKIDLTQLVEIRSNLTKLIQEQASLNDRIFIEYHGYLNELKITKEQFLTSLIKTHTKPLNDD